VRTGESRAVPLPEATLSSFVAAFPDGGYLALLGRIERSLGFSELDFVRPDGTLGWRHVVTGMGPDDTALDRAVYFKRGLARTGDESFAILSMRELTRVDLDRRVLAMWDLEELLGRKPGYLNGLLSDPAGGVLFKDGNLFHRIDAFGARANSFQPMRRDGTHDLDMDRLLRVAPDGRLWTSDRHELYRLDDAGVADLVLGPETRDDVLRSSERGTIDVLGRVLVQDAASGSVHVFNAEGGKLAVCRVLPSERPGDVPPEGLLSWKAGPFGGAADGSVWIRTREGQAIFDASGERRETRVAPKRLDDARDRTALEAIQTRPDGTWFEQRLVRARLTDGRLVIAEDSDLSRRRPPSLHLYTAAGEPLRSLALPRELRVGQLCIGPRWVVVGGWSPPWALVRLEDERVFRFEPELGERTSWNPGQTPEGRTLLFLDVRGLELVRYELP